MEKILEWFENANPAEFIIGVVCVACLLRIIYEIIVGKK
jgi:hypothetical protein